MQTPHFELFFSKISGIYRDIQRLRAQYAKETGVKSVHIFWIYLLREHGEGLTAAQLAQASQTTGSLVSREIQDLVEGGYLYTDTQPGRRRYAWKFHLTPAGENLAAQIDQIAQGVQSTVSRDISREDLETFYRVLLKLSDGFSELNVETLKNEHIGGNTQ